MIKIRPFYNIVPQVGVQNFYEFCLNPMRFFFLFRRSRTQYSFSSFFYTKYIYQLTTTALRLSLRILFFMRQMSLKAQLDSRRGTVARGVTTNFSWASIKKHRIILPELTLWLRVLRVYQKFEKAQFYQPYHPFRSFRSYRSNMPYRFYWSNQPIGYELIMCIIFLLLGKKIYPNQEL